YGALHGDGQPLAIRCRCPGNGAAAAGAAGPQRPASAGGAGAADLRRPDGDTAATSRARSARSAFRRLLLVPTGRTRRNVQQQYLRDPEADDLRLYYRSAAEFRSAVELSTKRPEPPW